MTTDAKGPYPLNRNLSLDLQAGAIQAFIPSHEAGQPSGDRISGTLLSACFDNAPMGISLIHPETARSGSVTIDATDRTSGVLFDVNDALPLDTETVKPIGVIVKHEVGIVVYVRPTEDEARKLILGHDQQGYWVSAKVFAQSEEIASIPALQQAYDAIQPLSSFALPVAV